MTTTESPIDLLAQSIDRVGTPACVGIDPVFEKIPRSLRLDGELEAIESFSLRVLDSIAGVVPAVKPQSACFERYGSAGYAILEKVIDKARQLGFIVILDAKRADIGSSAEHYAIGAANMGAHCITVSPYMGSSSIEPFLKAGLGVFALARTSNPDSDEIQLQTLQSGGTIAQAVGSMLAAMGDDRIGPSGLSALGAVVGATKAGDELSELRRVMPNQMFLVPGIGAQGGTIADISSLIRVGADSVGQMGVIVNASRSVIYAKPEGDGSWLSAVRNAAMVFAQELRGLRTPA
jgi:orotidine-5'-phosphate decarboxylase